MTINYQLEPSDFIAFSEERKKFVPDSLSRLYYFGIVPLLTMSLAVTAHSVPIAAIFMVLFLASSWFIQSLTTRLYRRAAYTEENLLFSVRRWAVTLADEGMRVSSDAGEGLYRWPFIKRVYRRSRYIHFELTPLHQVHIPIRAFEDEDQIQKFLSIAQAYAKCRTA